ncbi:MAG: protein-L-isoaspartate(D-aspartate) O-methyltransferase, partial [Bryobacteraceae bacterium]
MNPVELRREMVENQLRRRGIRDERVLAAMLAIPREEFVPEPQRKHAYDDAPLSIGHGQSISQPYITALMTEQLKLRPRDNVLEIGAGSGYHAAVLADLAARVTSIETISELAAQARQNLERTGYSGNVAIVCADGSAGWPAQAPYDAISVAAAAPEIPWQLLDQLADPGRLV